MERKYNKAGLSAIENMIVTSLIIVFFVGIIVVYYIMLYSETKDNIIKSGELNAISAAEQVDKYLSTGDDVIRLTAYTLDNMIREKRTYNEMLDYIVNQTVAASNIILIQGNTNGIYAYINDRYLDGVGWVPDEDYEPTERPWYTDARAKTGKVVVVDPYIDAQTGTTTITLAKTLCDTKSVVAIDISLETLQSITEELALQENAGMEIILDHNNHVVAHSDRSEIGKDYTSEHGTLGSELIDAIKTTNKNYFSLTFDGSEYIVYKVIVQNDWTCLSVIDATNIFDRLRIPLILTIIAAALIITILLYILIRSNKKSVLAEEMKELAELQTKYAYHDQMTGLKNRRAYAEMIDEMIKGVPMDLCVIMFDVNGLKTVNDTYGHAAGDELITAAADCIRTVFEGTDDIFRLGGDEFAVIKKDPDKTVEADLERLNRAAESFKGKYINGFSVSYGVGRSGEQMDIGSIVKEADRRMYDYKDNYYMTSGKDRRKKKVPSQQEDDL